MWPCVANPHVAKLCEGLKQHIGFILHPLVTKKKIAEMPRKLAFMWLFFLVETLAQKCTYITSNFRKNGPLSHSFPIAFSKNENGISAQKAEFLDDFPSYSHFSKLSSSSFTICVTPPKFGSPGVQTRKVCFLCLTFRIQPVPLIKHVI